MAISRISSGAASTFTGTYATGDLLVILSFNNVSSTVPSTPAGYTALSSSTNTSIAMVVLYKFATSGSESYPTITNSAGSVWGIYRGVNATTPFTNTGGQSSSGASTTISYSGIVTFANPAVDWVLTFGTAGSATAAVGTHPPTAQTLLTGAEVTGTTMDIAIFDSNAAVSSYSFNSKTLSASALNMTKTTELQAAASATFIPTPNRLPNQAVMRGSVY